MLAAAVVLVAAFFRVGGAPLAVLLFLPIMVAGYAVSAPVGRTLLTLSTGGHLWLRLAGDTGPAAALFAVEGWIPVVALALVAVAGEHFARASAERRELAESAEEARRAAEQRAAEEARLSRSLAAVASGLQSSFEPDRMLQRFCTLVRALLGAEAVLILTADESRNVFQILEASGASEGSLPELREMVFSLDGIARTGIVPLSFSAGESGLLGPVMREHFGAATGFGAPILRGKQLAGLLLAGYRRSDRSLPEIDRSLLAGSAALCATIFESARLHRELRSSNRVKTDFISTVSHELRTPLNAIIGYCDLLRDGTMGEINDDQRDTLDRLKRYSVEFTQLIEAVLEADRFAGGYISVDWIDCDLDVFFRQLTSSIPGHWQSEGVELRWVGQASRTIRTDPEKLRLCLRNLIHNALKFTREGSVTVEMSVTPGTLVFTVRDTGIGIRPEVRESLFQMFQPGDRSNFRTQSGLGLGLYLADHMVKALWGQISIESAPGQGTTVRVILPVEEPITADGA